MKDIIFNRRNKTELYTDTLIVFDDDEKLEVSVNSASNTTETEHEAAIVLSEKNAKALHAALGNWLKNKRLEHAMRDGGGL